jgi:hypothetical protein
MKNSYEIRGDVTAIFVEYKGRVLETLIDTTDLEKVLSFPNKWHVRPKQSGFYVEGHTPRNNYKRTSLVLSRFLFDNPKGLVVDHINHDTLMLFR